MWLTTNETEQIKKDLMIDALVKTLGVVTPACKLVKVWRTTHYQWLIDDEVYKQRVEDVGNIAIDFAESSLHKQIQDHDTTATIFYLKTKGKKRGYIEKIEWEIKFTWDLRVDLSIMSTKQLEEQRKGYME